MNIYEACQIMGISTESTQEEIKKKYQKLVLQYHPDRNKSPDASKKLIEVVEAYKFLRNTPTERKRVEPNYENFNNYSAYTSTSTQSTTWNFSFD